MKRTLRLSAERLGDLSSDELRAVQGGDATLPVCLSAKTCMSDCLNCRVSEIVMSLCGCLTSYCSFDRC